MHSHFWQPPRVFSAAVLATAIAVPQLAPAQATSQASDHVVSPQELNKATQEATRARQQNIDTLRGFFSSPKAQKALEEAHMNPQEVQNAIAGLNDHELAQLAARATKAQNDFAAGASDHDLLLIIVILAAVILLIVLVH